MTSGFTTRGLTLLEQSHRNEGTTLLKQKMSSPRSNASSSSDGSVDTSDAYRSSKQKLYSRFCLACIGLAILAMVLPTCLWGKVDMFASIAAGYTLSVLLLQHWMMEWPQCDARPIGLIVAAVVVFCLPTILARADLLTLYCRLALFAADIIVAAATYRLTIRGPPYEPAAGSMVGQIVILTGCNSGIGLVTAKTLARAGAKIIFACRTESKAKEAMQEVLQETRHDGVSEEQLKFIQLDLSSLASVRTFVQKFQETGQDLHVLVCNAGAFFPKKGLTQDGLDACLASNHLGHFLLIQLLLPALLATEKKGCEPRIVAVSSCLAYEQKAFDFSQARKITEEERSAFLDDSEYEVFRAYGQSKIAGMMCLRELAARLQEYGSQIPVNAVHPGEIDTNITGSLHPALAYVTKVFKPFVRLMLKSPYQGSIGTVYACTSPDMAVAEDMTGQFMMRLAPIAGNDAWLDDNDNHRCWITSIQLTGAPDVVGV